MFVKFKIQKERIMKKVLFFCLMFVTILSEAYSYAPFNFPSEDAAYTANFNAIMAYVDNGEEQKAVEYIEENNITKEELSFYLISSPDVMPLLDNIDYIRSESEKYDGGFDLGGVAEWGETCNKRLTFLLNNGANAFEYQLQLEDGPVTVPDYLALAALTCSSDYPYLSNLYLKQIDLIYELSIEFNALKDFKYFFDLGLIRGRFGFGDDFSYGVITKLINYFGCEPSEDIFLSMLNHYNDHNWFELAVDLASNWVQDGYSFSRSTINSFAESVGEYFDEHKYYSGLNPDGILKLLNDMGYDFSDDSYEILFDAIQDPNVTDDEIKYVIEQQDAWNVRNDDGETLLMHIAAYTSPERVLVKFMLEGGSDITRVARDRSSVLIFATQEFAPIENIRVLIESGADVLAKNKDEYNALSILFKNASPNTPYNPLFPTDGNFDFIDDYFCPLLELLIESGVPLNDEDKFGWTISGFIARARSRAYYSDNKVFELLYDSGLDFSSKSGGKTVSQIISSNGNTELEDFLLDNGLL